MRSLLLRFAASPHADVKAYAEAALNGSEAALTPLHDALIETGVSERGLEMLGLKVGDKVLIRTVTHYHVGEVEEVDMVFARLKNAVWVADTGRFGQCLEKGTLEEFEPFPNGCCVAIAAIVDVAPWNHKLPVAPKK